MQSHLKTGPALASCIGNVSTWMFADNDLLAAEKRKYCCEAMQSCLPDLERQLRQLIQQKRKIQKLSKLSLYASVRSFRSAAWSTRPGLTATCVSPLSGVCHGFWSCGSLNWHSWEDDAPISPLQKKPPTRLVTHHMLSRFIRSIPARLGS